MLLWATTPEELACLTAWAEERMPEGAREPLDACGAAAVVRDGEVVAAVVFHDHHKQRRTMQVSLASDVADWATPGVVRDLLRYPFAGGEANKLWCATEWTNTRAAKFAEGIGMKREATLRHHLGHKRHVCIFSMTRGEWQRSHWFTES